MLSANNMCSTRISQQLASLNIHTPAFDGIFEMLSSCAMQAYPAQPAELAAVEQHGIAAAAAEGHVPAAFSASERDRGGKRARAAGATTQPCTRADKQTLAALSSPAG